MEQWAIDQIVKLLHEEKELYSEISSISERKKRLIISGDINELDHVVKTEEDMISRLAACEKDRISLSETLAGQLGIPKEAFSLKLLAERVGDPGRQTVLLKLRDDLSSVIRKQVRDNNTIKELLKRKKKYSNMMLGLMQSQPICATYDSRGSVGTGYSESGIFDWHV